MDKHDLAQKLEAWLHMIEGGTDAATVLEDMTRLVNSQGCPVEEAGSDGATEAFERFAELLWDELSEIPAGEALELAEVIVRVAKRVGDGG